MLIGVLNGRTDKPLRVRKARLSLPWELESIYLDRDDDDDERDGQDNDEDDDTADEQAAYEQNRKWLRVRFPCAPSPSRRLRSR